MAVSVARPEDRVAAAIAFEEAAMAAVVEDLIDEETLDTLRSTSDDLVSMTGLPSPGSLAAIGAPTEVEGRGLLVVTVVAIIVIALAVIAFLAGGRSALVALALAVAMVAGLWRRHRRTDP
jgi:hypothetical protein